MILVYFKIPRQRNTVKERRQPLLIPLRHTPFALLCRRHIRNTF